MTDEPRPAEYMPSPTSLVRRVADRCKLHRRPHTLVAGSTSWTGEVSGCLVSLRSGKQYWRVILTCPPVGPEIVRELVRTMHTSRTRMQLILHHGQPDGLHRAMWPHKWVTVGYVEMTEEDTLLLLTDCALRIPAPAPAPNVPSARWTQWADDGAAVMARVVYGVLYGT